MYADCIEWSVESPTLRYYVNCKEAFIARIRFFFLNNWHWYFNTNVPTLVPIVIPKPFWSLSTIGSKSSWTEDRTQEAGDTISSWKRKEKKKKHKSFLLFLQLVGGKPQWNPHIFFCEEASMGQGARMHINWGQCTDSRFKHVLFPS